MEKKWKKPEVLLHNGHGALEQLQAPTGWLVGREKNLDLPGGDVQGDAGVRPREDS